jgi:predicted  nucleic acid-binding Zn-ribbon protein
MADKPSGRALTVEQVLEREEKRFEERAERARKELADAEEELTRIRRARAALDGQDPSQWTGGSRK